MDENTITLRDHSLPCEHGLEQYCNQPRTDLDLDPGVRVLCPGGRERRFRLTTLKDHTVKPDDTMMVEVDDE